MSGAERVRAIVGVVVGLVWSLPASAQVRTSDPMVDRAVSLDAELTAGGARRGGAEFPIVVGSIDLGARLARISPEINIELEAGLRLGYLEPESFRIAADPVWAAMWMGTGIAHRTPGLTIRGAVGLAPPLRSVVSAHVEESQLAAAWGNWDQWLVIEQVVPFGLRGLVEGRLGDVDVGADAALILGPCWGGENPGALYDARRTGIFFWGAFGGWINGHLSEVFSLGLRVQGVATVFHGATPPIVTGPIIDTRVFDELTAADFQLSAIPFVRASFAPGWIELRWQVNLDEPHGPIFDGSTAVWALALRGGASWDP